MLRVDVSSVSDVLTIEAVDFPKWELLTNERGSFVHRADSGLNSERVACSTVEERPFMAAQSRGFVGRALGPGPKGRDPFGDADAALKACSERSRREPLFHGGTRDLDYHLSPPLAKIRAKGVGQPAEAGLLIPPLPLRVP